MEEILTVEIFKTSFMLNGGRRYYFVLECVGRYYFMINGDRRYYCLLEPVRRYYFLINGGRRYYFKLDSVRRYYFSNTGNLFPFDICYDPPQYRQPGLAYPQKNLSMHVLTSQLL